MIADAAAEALSLRAAAARRILAVRTTSGQEVGMGDDLPALNVECPWPERARGIVT
jgi:hypothetical protein